CRGDLQSSHVSASTRLRTLPRNGCASNPASNRAKNAAVISASRVWGSASDAPTSARWLRHPHARRRSASQRPNCTTSIAHHAFTKGVPVCAERSSAACVRSYVFPSIFDHTELRPRVAWSYTCLAHHTQQHNASHLWLSRAAPG